jgi:HlyD family type I secretion membrane fusion protein
MDAERIELMPAPIASTDWYKMLCFGGTLIVFVFVVLGGWSAVARIDSAVVADGAVAVMSNRKTIQHLEGGIVSEILVRDGDTVQAGQTLLRLDPTRSEAADKGYQQQLAIAKALEARLIAQRDLADTVTIPPDVAAVGDDPIVASAIRDNLGQFSNRRESLLRGTEVIAKQLAQARDEVRQADIDQQTAQAQLDSIAVELPNLRELLQKGLVALPRVTTLERQQIQVQGMLDTARINSTKAKEKVGEFQARIDQLKQDYRQEAANALPEVRKNISDTQQQLTIARDALRRVDIKAPVTGTVQQLKVFTVGGVVKPGDSILDIIPLSDVLVVRVKVQPVDIDRILSGENVEIRIPQFMKFELKPIIGVVRSISRDSVVDAQPATQADAQPYFAVEIAVDRASIPEELHGRVMAGMTVTAIIRTQERTVLSYLAAPLTNRLAKALHER